MKLFVVLSTILVGLVQSLSCHKLVAVEVGAELSFPTLWHASLYDGEDTIYILGGAYKSKIYTYNLSSDCLKELTTFPNLTRSGFATFNNEGDILYMGGYNGRDYDGNIYKLEVKCSRWDLNVVETNKNFGQGRGIKAIDGSNTLFIPSDNGTTSFMYCLNLSTFESCKGMPLRTRYESVRLFDYDGYAYLTGTYPKGFIEKVNLETLESELIDAKLPYLAGHEVVFDGTYAYIIGIGIESSNNGIIRLNPQSMEHEFFTVENFPVSHTDPRSYWYEGSGVYVEKLNRIYFSGGQTTRNNVKYNNRNSIRKEIWYIDLTPIAEPIPSTTTEVEIPGTSTEVQIPTTLNPDIFTCLGKPQGFYPHQNDCAQFIGCRNGIEDLFVCQVPLLFSPVLLMCTIPEDVDCDMSCINKRDGFYMHPHDCSLYIICNEQTLQVHKCPPPLLFDPESKRCNYPDEVQCQCIKQI